MTTSFFIKDKKNNFIGKKKRVNWNQSLNTKTLLPQVKKVELKKSLLFVLFLKKFNNSIDFKNIHLLKGFLTKSGKIRARRKTRILPIQQRKIAKAIKKARSFGLLPFTCNVKF